MILSIIPGDHQEKEDLYQERKDLLKLTTFKRKPLRYQKGFYSASFLRNSKNKILFEKMDFLELEQELLFEKNPFKPNANPKKDKKQSSFDFENLPTDNIS